MTVRPQDVLNYANGTLTEVQGLVSRFVAEQRALSADTRWSATAKAEQLAQFESECSTKINDLIAPRIREIETAMQGLDADETDAYMTKTIEPKNDAGWQAVQARRDFVQQELEQLAKVAPLQIGKRFEWAIRKENWALAFLLKQFGPSALQAAGRYEDAAKLQERIAEIERPDLNATQELRSNLSKVKSQMELTDWLGISTRKRRAEMRASYGL